MADDAPEFVQLDLDDFGISYLRKESIRIDSVQPLFLAGMFENLLGSAFDDVDPPLWLRGEILDEAFFDGKV